MFTVVNHFETGQEYMSRYMAVDTEADTRGWQPRLRLKGIDVTVYAHQLFRALAIIARRLGHGGDEAEWRSACHPQRERDQRSHVVPRSAPLYRRGRPHPCVRRGAWAFSRHDGGRRGPHLRGRRR